MSTRKSSLTKGLQTSLQTAPDTPEVINEESRYLDNNFEREFALERLKTHQVYNKTLRQNTKQRKIYAARIFSFTCFWAVVIFVIIFFQGFKLSQLSDNVLIALITTTTINFFVFFLLVVKYLFNTGEKQEGIGKTSASTNEMDLPKII